MTGIAITKTMGSEPGLWPSPVERIAQSDLHNIVRTELGNSSVGAESL